LFVFPQGKKIHKPINEINREKSDHQKPNQKLFLLSQRDGEKKRRKGKDNQKTIF